MLFLRGGGTSRLLLDSRSVVDDAFVVAPAAAPVVDDFASSVVFIMIAYGIASEEA